MTEFEWESKMGRKQAAELLRKLADGLAGGGDVKLEHDGFELKVASPKDVEIEVEVEVDGSETEVEIELKWATGGGGRSAAKRAAPGSADSARGKKRGRSSTRKPRARSTKARGGSASAA